MPTTAYPFYVRYTITLLGVVLTLIMLSVCKDIIVPILFAMFMSILLNPIVNFLNRKRVPRVISIGLSLLTGIVIIAGVCAFLGFQISMFADDSADLQGRFKGLTNEVLNWIAGTFNVKLIAVKQWFSDMQNESAKNFVQGLGGTIATMGSLAIVVFVIPVYVFLILYYKPLLLDFIGKLFRKEHHTTLTDVLQSTNSILKSYLFGLLIEALIVAFLNSAGLLLIGVKYAILLGITGAILNLIPYIGGIVAVALPMIVALLTGSPLSALAVLGLYTVIQFIDNNYLVPAVVASRVKINALASIVAVLAGGLLWGIAGMFMAIPLTALVKVVCDHIEELKPVGIVLGDSMPESNRPILIFTDKKKAG